MEINNLKSKNLTVKSKLILIFALVVVGIAGYGYYWFSGVLERDARSQALIINSEKYISFKKAVDDEYGRCQGFISQSQGDFGSFEYCKKFIEWTNQQNILTR